MTKELQPLVTIDVSKIRFEPDQQTTEESFREMRRHLARISQLALGDPLLRDQLAKLDELDGRIALGDISLMAEHNATLIAVFRHIAPTEEWTADYLSILEREAQ